MSTCRKCGEALQPGDTFCGNCGTPVPVPKAYPPVRPTAPPKPKGPRRRSTLIATLVLVVIAVVAAFAAYSYVNHTPQCTLPSGYSQYSAPNPYFAFGYPTGWNLSSSTQTGGSQEVFLNSQQKDLFMVAGSDQGYSLSQEKASDEQFWNLTATTVAGATEQSSTVAGISTSLYTYQYNCNPGSCTLYLYIFFQNGYAFFSMFATSNPAAYSAAIGDVMGTFTLQPGSLRC